MKKFKRVSRWKSISSFLLLCVLAVVLVFADKIEYFVGYKKDLDSHQITIDKINQANYAVSYIDVGQGNSSLIEFPDGKNLLIDGGDIEFGETVDEFLKSRNVESIDYMVATHADSDHVGGLNYILDKYEVKNIYRPFQIAYDDDNERPCDDEDLAEIYNYYINKTNNKSKISKITSGVYQTFVSKIYSETYEDLEGTKPSTVTVFYDGLKITGKNYEVKFFAPLVREDEMDISYYSERTAGYVTMGFGASSEASNDNSAIFTVTCFGDKYLFVGDASFSSSNESKSEFSEYEFLNSLTTDEKFELSEVDVLLAGHHGSKYSTSNELLDLINPRFVVISVGKNSYGHPEEETLERIAKSDNLEDDYLLRTDQNGDIIFSRVDDKLMYYLERQGTEEKLRISFRVLCVIITFSLIAIIFSIREKNKRNHKANFIDSFSK